MPKIIKHTLLQYLPSNFSIETSINPERIFNLNNKPVKKGIVIYLCERELRAKDNFALQFAIQKAKELNSSLKIIYPEIYYEHKPKQNFINEQINFTKEIFLKSGFDFEIFKGSIKEYLKKLNPSLLIIDFNPISDRNMLKELPFKIYEIDSHNIVPARFISNKQEYGAKTIRRKIYYNIYPFFTEFDNTIYYESLADNILDDFIKNKLQYYSEFKNNPSKNVLSGLSKFLNLGFISSQRVAIEVVKSNIDNYNKEIFLEELIVRKELADNFCLYCKDYKDFSCTSDWAKKTLNSHKNDIRTYIYSLEEFEKAKTHDELWNSTQKQLLIEGVIHSYLRMYWAKKISEWSINPESALKIAIYLNDKYAFDSPSPNGYTGILWAIAGLHDRAFKDFFVTGKIRRMTYNSIKKKFDLSEYMSFFN